MKAIRVHEYGGPLFYEETADPVAAAGQVVVRVAAVGVNPADWKIISGKVRSIVDYPMPLIPGGDIAGRIDALGKGASGFVVGDEAFGFIGLTGAYAERVPVGVEQLAPKPRNITFEEAASLPLVALTAWQALFADGQQCLGKRILVHNAAGGVGSVAVQIAKAKGAFVIGTASPKNADFVRALGADEVVDFRLPRVEDLKIEVDTMLDLVGNDEAKVLWRLVRAGGHVIRVAGGGGTPPRSVQDERVIIKMTVQPNGAQLEGIAQLVATGRLRAEVTQTFSLADARQAHALSMGGHVRGKIALRVI